MRGQAIGETKRDVSNARIFSAGIVAGLASYSVGLLPLDIVYYGVIRPDLVVSDIVRPMQNALRLIAGPGIAVAYGVLFGWLYALVHTALPGRGWTKGLSFGLGVAFLGYSRALVESLAFTTTPMELSLFWLLEFIPSYIVLGVVLAVFCRSR